MRLAPILSISIALSHVVVASAAYTIGGESFPVLAVDKDTDDTERDYSPDLSSEEGNFWKRDGSYSRDYCYDDEDYGCYE